MYQFVLNVEIDQMNVLVHCKDLFSVGDLAEGLKWNFPTSIIIDVIAFHDVSSSFRVFTVEMKQSGILSLNL